MTEALLPAIHANAEGRVYIAGPMTGFPKFNAPAFREAAQVWRAQQWEVISPLELDNSTGFNEHLYDDEYQLPQDEYRQALARDVAYLAECSAIALLPGWENSAGARAEVAVAQAMGLTFFQADGKHLRIKDLFDILTGEAA